MQPTGVRKTLSDTAIYGIGKALQQSVGLLMLPIYTRFLDPSDYGTLSLLTVAVHTIAALFGLEVVTALFRYYFDSECETERRALVSTSLVISIGLKLAVLVVVISSSPALATVFLADSTLSSLVTLFAITVVTDVMMFVPMEYLRILNRPISYVAVSLSRLLTQLGLNIWFLAFLGFGIKGVIFSNLISGTILGVGLVTWTLRRTGFSYSQKAARTLMRYSWPLVFSSMLSFYAHQIGPISLTHTWGLTQVGLFALALKFDSVTRLLVLEPLMQSWGPLRFQVYKQENAKEVYQKVFTVFLVAIIGAATVVSVLASDIIHIMADSQYWPAATLVPAACLFSVSLSVYHYCGFSVLVKDKTGEVAKAIGLMGAVVTAVLLMFLVEYGALAVLIAIVSGSTASAVWVYWKGARVYDMQLPWRKFWAMLAIGCATYFASTNFEPATFTGTSLKLLLLFMFFVITFLSPIVGPEGRSNSRAMLRQLASRLRRTNEAA